MLRALALCCAAVACALFTPACRTPPSEAKKVIAPPQDEAVYKVTAVHVPGTLKVGDTILIRPAEVGIYSDPATWARMTVSWEAGAKGGLSGTLGTGEKLELGETAEGKAVMRENGELLCDLERLSGQPADDARKAILARPDLAAMRKQAAECFASFDATLPDAKTFASTKPESFHTTASARNVLFLAQSLLAEACKPIPPQCLVADTMEEQRQKLADAAARCSQGAAAR